MTSLINKSAVRKFLLEHAAQTVTMGDGKPRFTRIEPPVFLEVEEAFKTVLRAKVRAMGRVGRTIY